jgi:hypothetical protein
MAAKRGIRVERRVYYDQHIYETISIEISTDANINELSVALHDLDRIAPLLSDMCPACHTPFGKLHYPDCSMAPDDFIGFARKEMEEDIAKRGGGDILKDG